MTIQRFLKTLKTAKKVYLPKSYLSQSSNLQNPNHEIANSIFKTLITTGSQSLTTTSLLNDLNSTTLHFVLSNPQLRTGKCFDFFNFLLQNQSLISFKLDLQPHLTLICRLLEARRFADAENVLKSVSVDVDMRYPFCDIVCVIQEFFEVDEDCDGNVHNDDLKIYVKLFNLMLKVYSDNGMYSEVSQTFDYMKYNKVQIDERTCTIHLIALKWSNQVEAAVEFFYRMIEAGIEVSVYSLWVVVEGLCKSGEIKSGRELVEVMIGKGIKPNIITFNVLIESCTKRWNFEELDLMLALMKKEGVDFNDSTYKVLIDGFLSSGKIEEAKILILEMHDKGLKVDVYLYGCIINAYCRRGEMENAFSVFDIMNQREIKQNVDVYGGLINGLCEAGKLDDAKLLINEMQSKGIELDMVMFNVLMVGYCKNEMIDEALELLVSMEKKGLNTYVSVYDMMITGLSKLNRMHEVKEIMSMMVKRGISPNTLSSNSLDNDKDVK